MFNIRDEMAGPILNITVNGQSRIISAGTSLARLLCDLRLNEQQVAVEVNRVLVPRERHDSHELSDADELEIVTLAGGG